MKLLAHGCVGLILGATLLAQGESDARHAEMAADLKAIFERPAGTVIDHTVAMPRFEAFFAKYEGVDLGPYGYAPALRDYLARDYTAAVVKLDAWMERGLEAPIPEHRSMLGRVYLNILGLVNRGEAVEPEKLRHAAAMAVRLYDDPQIVARLVNSLSTTLQGAEMDALRIAVVREVVLRDLPVESQLATVRMLVLDPGARPANAAATRSASAQGDRASVPELKPFTSTTMSGKEVSLETYRGKVLLVDFWATWCSPCIREMPHVVAAYEKYKDQGFEVLGVSLDEANAEDAIRAMEARLGMTWEQIYDGQKWNAALAKANDIRGIPATFLIDRSGKTRYVRLRGSELDRRVAELLAEKARD